MHSGAILVENSLANRMLQETAMLYKHEEHFSNNVLVIATDTKVLCERECIEFLKADVLSQYKNWHT